MKITTNKKHPYSFKNQWWWKIIVALEVIFSVMLIWLVCYLSLYVAYVKYDVDTIFKYPIYFQVYFSLFLCLFIPMLFWYSLRKKYFAKYCFLVVGIVCILSGGAIFATYAVLPNTPLHSGIVDLTISSFADLLPFVLIPNMGMGYILRFWCMKRYYNASYFNMLTERNCFGYIRFAFYLLWWCIYFYVFQLFTS